MVFFLHPERAAIRNKMPSKKEPKKSSRVKVSWQEALGVEAGDGVEGEASTGNQKPPKEARPKRPKKHRNDVRSEQDLDAVVDPDSADEADGSSSDLQDSDLEKFGGAGFVMIDLEDELEELALVATEEGFASIRVSAPPKSKKNKKKKAKKAKAQASEAAIDTTTSGEAVVSAAGSLDAAPVSGLTKEAKKKMKKEAKKLKQAQKLLDALSDSDADDRNTSTKKKSKKEKRAQAATAVKADDGSAATTSKVKGVKKVDKGQEDEASSGKKAPKKKKKKSNAVDEKQAADPEEKQAAPLKSGTEGNQKKTESATGSSRKNAHDNGRFTYAEYLDRGVVTRGLEMGTFLQGKLRVNSMYRMDGYISVNGLAMDVLVKGMQDRNRALDGDLVAIRLHPESQWKLLNDQKESDDDASAASAPMSSSAGVDLNALHSLWLPSVEAEQCFVDRSAGEESSVDMLKQHFSGLNERIKASRRRPTASVVFVLADGNANGFIGSLEARTKVKDLNAPLSSDDAYAYFNGHDLRLPRRIQIPRLQLPDEFVSRPLLYSKTMLCFCRIKAWSTKHQSPVGEFVKTVGEYTGIETGISAILSKHGLQAHTLDFDSSILDELDAKYGISGEKFEIPLEELQKRRDFREDAQIFSIDPYNARDLDDALHIRALNDARTKFEIGVHIADVTHFIEHNSLLDREAQSRATSVYLANRVLPMLPRILCEKLCSLQPQVDRLAFSVVWQMNVDGTLVEGVEPWFGKSVIRSCCKLDYGSAQKMLDGGITSDKLDEWEEDRRPIAGANPSITNASVIQSVKDLWSIGENRRAMRFETGAVSLNDIKLVFSLDAKGNPTRYGSYELKDSNRLVEEYMLLANFLVAQQLLRAHGPLAFLRHHPPPVSRAMEQAIEQLDKSDIKLDGRSTKQLSESLEQVRQTHGETKFAIVQAMIIKPMKPAEYMVAGNGASADSWRHYALNIPYYTHFTSPIRRYADVVVHRLLHESVGGAVAPESSIAASLNPDLEARLTEFTSVAQNCNEKKMTSKGAEKECDQVFLCAYVKHHGAVDVTGVVLSMGQKSFTVYILELGLEQRLFLQDIHLTGSWNEKTAQLSIRLPVAKSRGLKATDREDSDQVALPNGAKAPPPSEVLKLSFMTQLHMRMSATKKMPLALTFAVVGEKL
ncbi:hypothetical protein BBJ28_00019806 [Nothophytophthora sp. Chile5]|nr:hypothetical protein BBJ28_00019806 [Nothophytophthora sp. Chile5]